MRSTSSSLKPVQRLSRGGAISYVEVPNMQDNLKAVIHA